MSDSAPAPSLLPIEEVASRIGLAREDLIHFGPWKAKVRIEVLRRLPDPLRGRLIVVTGMTPTPLGEGKTVNTIGLSMALTRLGRRAVATIRQPSMGPIFGLKGGATGGGRSQVVPIEEIDLHLTGDMHAVGAANNLLSAFIDNRCFRGGGGVDLEPRSVTFRRVMDISDRSLRHVITGLGGPKDGVAVQTGFDITPASEVMAILGLCSGRSDMEARLRRIIVGRSRAARPVTAGEVRGAGAMAAVLREAIHPNLVQTIEGTPCFMHTGPFANIAHGCSSILADQIALRLCDYVVTEAGFDASIGFEKLCNVKCRAAGFRPAAAVIVASLRALKVHSGRHRVTPGAPLAPALLAEDLAAVREGFPNLAKQVENVRRHGVPAVVALNRFPSDTARELDLARQLSVDAGAAEAVVSEVFERGSEGGLELAAAAERAAGLRSDFTPLYPLGIPIREKVELIAKEMYGAAGVEFSQEARVEMSQFEGWGFGDLPICVAKTQYSLSHDPRLKGRPRGFVFPVRSVRLAAGAGFIYPLAGDVMTMPGLPARPAGESVEMDEEGRISGLF